MKDKDKDNLIVTKENSCTLWILDFIKNSSNRNIWRISIGFVLAHFFLSILFLNSNIFSASGGVITILGLLIFVGISTPITLGEIQKSINSQTPMPQIKDNNGPEVIQRIAKTVDEVLHSREKQVLGLSVTIFGTLVWAYGWVIELLPLFSHQVNGYS
ncbi:MAG: hypothetical protein GQ547_09015 [Methylophaga sp.]|nr:hypothetical protein [Methylophaga sp.]